MSGSVGRVVQSIFRSSFATPATALMSKSNLLSRLLACSTTVPFTSMAGQKLHFSSLGFRDPASHALLAPPLSVNVNQSAGFKIKYQLKKRCKDCFIYVKDGRRSILCPTHGRHKQLNPVKKPKYTWTIAHAMQSKVRPW